MIVMITRRERSVHQLANEAVAPCTLLQLPRLLYDFDEPLVLQTDDEQGSVCIVDPKHIR
jgi:hypothetical protein